MKWFYKIYYNMVNDGPPYNENWAYYGYSYSKKHVKEFMRQRNPALYRVYKLPLEHAREYMPNGFKMDDTLKLIALPIDNHYHIDLVMMTQREHDDLLYEYAFPEILFGVSNMFDGPGVWFPDWKRVNGSLREAMDLLLYTSFYEMDVNYPREMYLPENEQAWFMRTPLGLNLGYQTNVFNVLKDDKPFRFNSSFNEFHFNRLIDNSTEEVIE